MPNVMVAVPTVQHRKVWLTPATRMPCSSTARMQNPLKFTGVPQTTRPISAASGPKCTILWGHIEEILLRNKFFSKKKKEEEQMTG